MAGSVAGKSTEFTPRPSFGRDLRKALLRKIWLPKILYDAVPWFYGLAGTVALLATFYIGGWLKAPPHALILPVSCLHLAIWVLLKRLRDRSAEVEVDDASRVRKDSAAW
jgi:hypothetical protein